MIALSQRRGEFSRTFWWVMVAHGIVIGLLCWWSTQSPAPTPKPVFTTIFDPRGMQGAPSSAVGPSEASEAPSAAPAAPTQVKTPPEIHEVEPTPVPAPTPEPIAPQVTREIPAPPTPVSDFPSPKPKKKVKVSLDEVVERSSASGTPGKKTVKSVKSSASSVRDGSGESASEIASRLGKGLSQAGVTGAVSVKTPGGGENGSGRGTSNAAAAYYALIREQMYGAWVDAVQFTGQKWIATIKIEVESDGRISHVSLVKSSGSAVFDESALAAARQVRKINRPRPEGMDGTISVDFEPGT
jgi:TonB family protein